MKYGIVFACVVATLLASSERPMLTRESDQLKIELLGIEKTNDSRKAEIRFRVHDKKTGSDHVFTLANRTISVDDIRIMDSERFLVIGQLSWGGNALTLMNRRDGSIIDTIRAYRPAIAPTGKLMAYFYRYPPHGAPPARTLTVIVYDLSRNLVTNKETSTSSGTTTLIDKHNHPPEREYIIYPDENRETRQYSIPYFNDNDKRGILSSIYWNAAGDILCFMEYYREKSALVVADLRQGLDRPLISRFEVDLQAYLNPGRDLKVPWLTAKELAFADGDGQVIITTFGGNLQDRIVVSLIDETE